MGLTIHFYKYTKDKRIINKVLNTSNMVYHYAEPRVDVDLSDFKLRIQYNPHTFSGGFNYAYIEQLNRYYFIEDVKYIAVDLWEIHLHCDVLMTYKDSLSYSYGVLSHGAIASDMMDYNDTKYDFSRSYTKQEYRFENNFNSEGNNILIALKQTE